jgi:hypothetical protein
MASLIHVCTDSHMYEFIYVWIHACTNSRMYGFTYVRIHACPNSHMHRFTHVWIHGWMDAWEEEAWNDGRMELCKDGIMEGWDYGRM